MKKLYLFILLLWLMPLISIASNLTGKVTVLSTGAPVQGAIIILQHNFTVHIDTTDAEGNYAFIYFEGMKFEVKVIKDHYNIIKDSIDIPEDMTIIHDFQLTAPTMSIIPESINDTLHSGVPYQRWVTVTNNGDGPLEWHTWAQTQYKKTEASSAGDFNIFQKIHSASFPLKDNPLLGSTGYAFSFGSNHLFFSFNTDDPSNMNIICADTMGMECCSFDATDNGIMYFICPLGYDNSDLMKMDVNTGEITDIGSTSPSIPWLSFWTGLACDRNTGIYYACATNWDESYLFTIDITTGASTLIGSTGLHYLQGIAIDGTGQMYGIDAASDKAYLIDKTTGAATALGPLGFDSYYRHDIAWNPEQDIIYVVANYDDNTPGAPPFSELRIMDRTNGNTYVVGHFADKVDGLCFTGEGYPSWLVVGSPVEGIIPADSSVNIPVTFDWNYIPPQKDITFQGNICFISNPDVGTATIPVTYTIVPPPPHYYLAGTITHAGQPVAGVTVTATNGSYSLSGTTGVDGTYWLSLDVSGTYVITTEAIGYNSYYGTCEIYDEYTPYDIYLTAPTMNISPDSLTISLNPNESGTLSLTLSNSGDGTLAYNVHVVSDSLWNYYVVPMSGYLGFGESTNLNFPVYANVPSGTYHAFIIFTSNVGTDSIPVTLTVLAGAYPTLTIQTVTNVEAGSVSVPVHANYISNLGSFQFTIEYDPALLTYMGTSDWYPGIDAVTIGEPIPGHLTFVWAAETQGINIPDSNFFDLDFIWNGALGQASNITWSDNPTIREFGDYNGNIFVPSYLNGEVIGNSIPPGSIVSINSVDNVEAGPVSVPVHAVLILNLGSFQFSIEYDPALLTFNGTSNWYPGINDVTVSEPTPGQLIFVWAAETQGINIPDGDFFTLDFTWNGVAGQTNLVWSDNPIHREFADYDGIILTPFYINGQVSGGSTFNSTVSIEDVIVPNESATDSVVVPVHAQFGINPNCFQFTIEYEPGMTSFQRVINWNPTIVDSVMVEEPTPGHITFQWCAETQGLNITDGHFFDLVFSWPILMDDWWLSIPITWSDDPMPRNFFWGYGDTIPVNYINGSASGWIVDGVHETTKKSVKIYPNPASDYLNVEVGNDICKINVINNLGITVYEQNITGGKTITLNTSGYRAGNYIVQLITKDGQTINRKMMKQ